MEEDYIIVPRGSATGPGWQYRLERAGQFTAWHDWAADFSFDADPDGASLRTNVLYWLYARNPLVPAFEPGSIESELAAGLEILPSGRVVSASPDGTGEGTTTGTSPSSDTLDDVAGRQPYADAMPNAEVDGLATYQQHPALPGKVLIRGYSWARIKEKLIYSLDELSELRTSRAIVIENGSSSFIINVNPGDPNPQGLRAIEPDGKETSFRRLADGTLELLNRNGQRFLLAENELIGTAQSAKFDQANLRARTTSRTTLPAATTVPTTLQGPSIFDPASGEYRDVFYTLAQIADALGPLLPSGTGGTGGGNTGNQGELLGCVDETPPAQVSQDFSIPQAQFGTSLSHNLQTTGDYIIPAVLGPDNQDALAYVDLVFTGTSSFIVTPRDVAVSADAAYYFKLNLRKIITP